MIPTETRGGSYYRALLVSSAAGVNACWGLFNMRRHRRQQEPQNFLLMGFSPTRPPAPKSTSTPSPSSHHRQRRRAAGKKPPTFKLASLEDAMLPPVLRREVLREQMSEYLSTSTNVRREVIIAFIRAVRLASLDVVETHVRWSKQHSRETKFVFKDHGRFCE